jgi:hypothetical protein
MDAAEKIFSGEFDDVDDDDGDVQMHSVRVVERATASSVHMAVSRRSQSHSSESLHLR